MLSLCVLSTICSHSVPNLSTNIMQQSIMNQKKEATCLPVEFLWDISPSVAESVHFYCG